MLAEHHFICPVYIAPVSIEESDVVGDLVTVLWCESDHVVLV